MKIYDRILAHFCIPRLTLCLAAGSATCYILGSFNPVFLADLPLIPDRVMQGELWRLATFLFYPLDTHPFFAFFTYYLFYIMGTALEESWGDERYTRFMLLGAAATAAFSFLNLGSAATNIFLAGSVFLAFAFLYPDYELYLFFVIPVRVKVLAAITWFFYIFQFVMGDISTRVMIAASVLNFLVIFRKDIAGQVRTGQRRVAEAAVKTLDAFHLCHECGLTELKDRHADFRVCSRCSKEFCMSHLKTHAHPLDLPKGN